MAKARLQATIGLRGGAFRRGLRRLSANVRRFSRNVVAPIANVGKAFAKMTLVGVGAASAGLVAIIKKSADFGDSIGKMAKRTGIATDELQRYKIAAELSGGSIDSMEKAVRSMSRFMLIAKEETKESARAMELMGLSIEDLEGLEPGKMFEAMLSAIAQIPDPVKRAGVALQVFGRSGTQLLPMLEGGAEGLRDLKKEADDMGIIMSAEQIAEAEAFNDELLRTKATIMGIFREIASAVMPALRRALEAFRGRLRPIIDAVKFLARILVDGIRVLAGGGPDAKLALQGFRKILEGVWTAVIKVVVGILLKAMPILAKAFANVAVAVIKAGISGIFGKTTDIDVNALIGKETEEAKSALDSFGDELETIKQGFLDLQEATKSLAEEDEKAAKALARGRGEAGVVDPGELQDIPKKEVPERRFSELRAIGANIIKGVTPVQVKDEEKKIAENTKQTVKHLSAHERYLRLLAENRGGAVFGS